MNRENLVGVFFVVAVVCFVSAIFFGVLAYQASAFYSDLIFSDAPREEAFLALMNKYESGWYFPNLLGFVSAVIAVASGIVTTVLMKGRPN